MLQIGVLHLSEKQTKNVKYNPHTKSQLSSVTIKLDRMPEFIPLGLYENSVFKSLIWDLGILQENRIMINHRQPTNMTRLIGELLHEWTLWQMVEYKICIAYCTAAMVSVCGR